LPFKIFVVSLHRITKSRLWKRTRIKQRKAVSRPVRSNRASWSLWAGSDFV